MTTALTLALLLTQPPKPESIVLGAGCFWCPESMYEQLIGVVDVESGYAGGAKAGVTYAQVMTGTTGHAEVIKVTFNPAEISRRDLLRIFFTIHDPTTLNRQGNDVGPQYRSAIFYANPGERKLAVEVIDEVTKQKLFKNKIVTTLEPLKNYTRAEEYHQNYFARFEKATEEERAKMNAGYCVYVVEPKVRAFRAKYASRLKPSR